MAKKLVPVSTGGKRVVQVRGARMVDSNLTPADCICATMAPHCPIHSTVKAIPAPGQDVIR